MSDTRRNIELAEHVREKPFVQSAVVHVTLDGDGVGSYIQIRTRSGVPYVVRQQVNHDDCNWLWTERNDIDDVLETAVYYGEP